MIESFGSFVKKVGQGTGYLTKKTAAGTFNLAKTVTREIAVAGFGKVGDHLTRPLAKKTVIKKPTKPRRKKP